MYRCFILPVVLLAMATSAVAQRPLLQAHAHNDYLHKRPLEDALAHGFCSVEADIFLVNDELLVAHTYFELRKGRTLQKLYLDPLRERVKKNDGRVYGEGPEFTLLIDIKANGPKTYTALHKVLQEYKDMLTTIRDGKVKTSGVRVIISGQRPAEMIAAQKTRYAAIDGRLRDLDSKQPAHLIPLISDRWSSHFRWRGKGPMPESERTKLNNIVKKAHQAGRRVRFWATPENINVWRELAAADVDLINTDDLPGLKKFLTDEGAEAGESGKTEASPK